MKAAALISTGNSATPQVVMIFPPAKVLRKVSLSLWMVAVLWERTAVDMQTSCCGTSAPNFITAKKKAPDCGGLSHRFGLMNAISGLAGQCSTADPCEIPRLL